jgi:hypothetical protein
MKDIQTINEAYLLEKLGPAPTVKRVSEFLKESNPTTWRRLKTGELEVLPGSGNARVSLKSLVRFINGTQPYRLTNLRGKKPGTKQQPKPAKG